MDVTADSPSVSTLALVATVPLSAPSNSVRKCTNN